MNCGKDKTARESKARPMRVFLVLALLIFGIAGSEPQANGNDTAEADKSAIAAQSSALIATTATTATPIPITYFASKTETPKSEAGNKLWRVAIISAGSFPFALFYANFIFDSVRFAANNFDVQYAPWPFKNQYSAAVSTEETFFRLGVSIGISAIIGMLDVVIPRR